MHYALQSVFLAHNAQYISQTVITVGYNQWEDVCKWCMLSLPQLGRDDLMPLYGQVVILMEWEGTSERQ